jgi:UDP-glucuronate 4-epimerase
MHKNYLVTGVAGFIGSHLAEKLLASDDVSIIGIDNFDGFYARSIKEENLNLLLTNPNFSFIEGDIRNTDWHSKLDGIKIDGIIHIAAKAGVLPSIKDPLLYEDVNIKGTMQLLEFAKKNSIQQFIFASSSSVYGVNSNVPWSEADHVLKPISPYACSKVANELTGYTYSILYNIRFLALRFFTVYGPRQRPDLAIHKFIAKIENGDKIQMYGDGSTKRDYTFVDDIVDGIIKALTYKASMYEIINIGNNQPVTLAELVSTIETVAGKKAIIERLPEQPGDVPITYADISKAKRLLNYNPETSLEEGIKSFYNWYISHKK